MENNKSTTISDDVSGEITTCRAGVAGFFVYFSFFLTKTQRYIDGGRHLKSNVQDGGDNTTIRTAKHASFAVYNRPKIVETLSPNGITSENKIIRTPPPSRPFIVGVVLVFNR